MSTGQEYMPPPPVAALHAKWAADRDHDAHTVGLLAYYWPSMDKAAKARVRAGRHYKTVMKKIRDGRA